MVRLITICALSITCTANLLAQTQAKAYSPVNHAEARVGGRLGDSQHDMFTFYGVVDRVLDLHDVEAKTMGAAQLADVLWKFDEVEARQLFAKSFPRPETNDESGKRDAFLKLRQDVLSLIAKHDAAWAKRLIDEQAATIASDKQSETNLTVASSLVKENPDAAVDFAARSLNDGVNPALIWFLKDLHSHHPKEADQLFMQALSRLVQQPVLNLSDLPMLGTYLFTSPKAINDDSAGGIFITRVGNVGVIDITADRVDASPVMIRAFLSAAVGVLSRPTSDDYQRQTAYALGYMLSPKVRAYAPELVGPLSSAMTSLAANLAPASTQDSAFANLQKVRPDTTDVMSNAASIPTAQGRDVAYLDVAYHAWLKKDFRTGRIAAAKITAGDAADELAVLMNYGEGANLLRQTAQLARAEELAARLPQGLERALLFLALSRRAAKLGDQSKAVEALSISLQAARAIDDSRRPFLVLSAAAGLADLDTVAAHTTLLDAIKDFNQRDAAQLRSISWDRRVEVGVLAERFPLEIDGLEFGPAFRKASSANIDQAILAAYDFKSEILRSRALVEIGATILDSLTVADQNKELVVRVGEDGMRKSSIKSVVPAYPEGAKKAGQKGVAVAELQYDGKGNVTDVVVLQSPGPSISEALTSALRQWKFKPSTVKGEPISVRGKLTFYFVIDKDGSARVENPKEFQ